MVMEKLNEIREYNPSSCTQGLGLEEVSYFLEHDKNLKNAILQAYDNHKIIQKSEPKLLKTDEAEQIKKLQDHYVNFYEESAVNPFVALAAQGPWLISTCGAIIHDSGGYGMLGLGHNPEKITSEMCKPHVMANIMTANFSQKRFIDLIQDEIGVTRTGEYKRPFANYLCLNSGSEAVSMGMRLSDVNAKNQTSSPGKNHGKKIKLLSLKGCFHGRTYRPALASESCREKYKDSLASFSDPSKFVTVEPNNLKSLKDAFQQAEDENYFIEAMLLEPVMGEGNPGQAITPAFYQLARELTRNSKTLLIVDSIQAGIRAHGYLSITDYPGFRELDPPDMEAYSKALNAGQYPFSVLAMTKETAKLYRTGLYGNTLTTNPRALDVASAVLENMTPNLRDNIQKKGLEFVAKLTQLKEKYPKSILEIKGTGLLFSVAFSLDKLKITGSDGLERKLRKEGIGVIHGGENSLRFTPHFVITSEEIDLIISKLNQALQNESAD